MRSPNLELGKSSAYSATYDPNKLYSISRKEKRREIGIHHALPFFGYDLWNHYEVSWLNEKGKPVVALASILYECDTPNIIESKSMKLYFNSFNNTRFNSVNTLKQTIEEDIEKRVGGKVTVNIDTFPLKDKKNSFLDLEGTCIDHLDIECSTYLVDSSFLVVEKESVEETVYSNILKSNCLVTNQPDWGSIQIEYKGNKINHEGLLRYIVSFRNHNEFHEHCIERIFMDILQKCQPTELTVYGRYTRRGGIDINPLRSTGKSRLLNIANGRLVRQ